MTRINNFKKALLATTAVALLASCSSTKEIELQGAGAASEAGSARGEGRAHRLHHALAPRPLRRRSASGEGGRREDRGPQELPHRADRDGAARGVGRRPRGATRRRAGRGARARRGTLRTAGGGGAASVGRARRSVSRGPGAPFPHPVVVVARPAALVRGLRSDRAGGGRPPRGSPDDSVSDWYRVRPIPARGGPEA